MKSLPRELKFIEYKPKDFCVFEGRDDACSHSDYCCDGLFWADMANRLLEERIGLSRDLLDRLEDLAGKDL